MTDRLAIQRPRLCSRYPFFPPPGSLSLPRRHAPVATGMRCTRACSRCACAASGANSESFLTVARGGQLSCRCLPTPPHRQDRRVLRRSRRRQASTSPDDRATPAMSCNLRSHDLHVCFLHRSARFRLCSRSARSTSGQLLNLMGPHLELRNGYISVRR